MFETEYEPPKLTTWERLCKWAGLHVHERRLFLLDEICMVKCVTCGAESIPWKVTKEKADAARPGHRNDWHEYTLIEQRIKEQQHGRTLR